MSENQEIINQNTQSEEEEVFIQEEEKEDVQEEKLEQDEEQQKLINIQQTNDMEDQNKNNKQQEQQEKENQLQEEQEDQDQKLNIEQNQENIVKNQDQKQDVQGDQDEVIIIEQDQVQQNQQQENTIQNTEFQIQQQQQNKRFIQEQKLIQDKIDVQKKQDLEQFNKLQQYQPELQQEQNKLAEHLFYEQSQVFQLQQQRFQNFQQNGDKNGKENEEMEEEDHDDDSTLYESIQEEIETKNFPIMKVKDDKAYVTGIISFQERNYESVLQQEIMQDDEELIQSVHLYPPKIYLLDFIEPGSNQTKKNDLEQKKENNQIPENDLIRIQKIYNHDLKKNIQIYEQIKKQYPPCFHQEQKNMENSLFYDQFGLWIEQEILGDLLTTQEKDLLYYDMLSRFIDFASTVPPCCKRTLQFWQSIILLLNPHSSFEWRFDNMNFVFFDYATEFIEFRGLFQKWLDSFSDIILEEYKNESEIIQLIVEQFFKFLRSMITLKNIRLSQKISDCKNQEKKQQLIQKSMDDCLLNKDLSNFIKNNGIHIPPIEYQQQCQCYQSQNLEEFQLQKPLIIENVEMKVKINQNDLQNGKYVFDVKVMK